MSTNLQSKKIQRIMTKPINLLFRLFHTKTRVQIWLYEQPEIKFEGKIVGFDEYMNLVLDDCEEFNIKKAKRSPLGRIMLKGDNISLVRAADGNN